MPTYDLHCARCDVTFEVFRQGFLTEADRGCTACGGAATQVLTGFVTSRPPRGRREPDVRGYGAHACGSGCGCGKPWRAPDGSIVPP